MDDAMKDTVNRMFSSLAETIRDLLMPLPEHPTGLAAETECPGFGHVLADPNRGACPHCGASL
ncbi:hypothetical protein ACFY9R_26515 [Streptomyces albidoflavus]|uniref:hypothetical protein n=1 Tax=Streptomyces albidoflavus TaxID=1886 RepID=UPI0033C981F4